MKNSIQSFVGSPHSTTCSSPRGNISSRSSKNIREKILKKCLQSDELLLFKYVCLCSWMALFTPKQGISPVVTLLSLLMKRMQVWSLLEPEDMDHYEVPLQDRSPNMLMHMLIVLQLLSDYLIHNNKGRPQSEREILLWEKYLWKNCLRKLIITWYRLPGIFVDIFLWDSEANSSKYQNNI